MEPKKQECRRCGGSGWVDDSDNALDIVKVPCPACNESTMIVGNMKITTPKSKFGVE